MASETPDPRAENAAAGPGPSSEEYDLGVPKMRPDVEPVMKTKGYKKWWKRQHEDSQYVTRPGVWDRFAAQVESGAGALEQAERSGANITLEDLAIPPEELPDELRPGSSFRRHQASDFATQAARASTSEDLDLPSDTYFGTPDPAMYAASSSTAALTPQQLEAERQKGNMFTLRDFKNSLSKAHDWELQIAHQKSLLDFFKNRFLVQLRDGSHVSFWSLFNYVYNNPELKALAQRNMDIETLQPGGTGSSRRERLRGFLPWQIRPNAPKMMLSPEEEGKLPFGLVANGNVWKRRPTRWLKGLDGLRDFAYGLYVHEQLASDLLGPKYAGRAPWQVLQQPQYFADIVKEAPKMGATLMFIASRPLPIREYRDLWTENLGEQLLRHAPTEDNLARLMLLYNLFKPERLQQQTKLLDVSGQNLREGSTLIMTTGPQGRLMVEAMSPGSLKDRECYLLGMVQDEKVQASLLDMFVGLESAQDLDFVERMGAKMLYYVNGFKSRNADNNPNVRLPSEPLPTVFDLRLLPRRSQRLRAFDLPAVDEPRQPTVLHGVEDRVTFAGVTEAFASAVRAAQAVPLDAGNGSSSSSGGRSFEAQLAARRAAAEDALAAGFARFGLKLQGLSIPPPADIYGRSTTLTAGTAAPGRPTQAAAAAAAAATVLFT